MKRANETELAFVVDKIFATANEKDEAGHYVHPLLNERNPAILTFFHTRDALLEVLKNRPVLFLNRGIREQGVFSSEMGVVS